MASDLLSEPFASKTSMPAPMPCCKSSIVQFLKDLCLRRIAPGRELLQFIFSARIGDRRG